MKNCINICGYFAEKTSKWPIPKISYRIKVYKFSNIYIYIKYDAYYYFWIS